DPPELQTFAVIDDNSPLSFDTSSLYHLGYFRDTPEEKSPVVVSNDPDKSCVINGVADNIFAAILSEMLKRKAKCKSNDPHSSKLKNFEAKLRAFASQHKIDINASHTLKKRKKTINAPTFHKFGIRVPVVGDVGYRELPETDDKLRKIFTKISSLDNDE